SPSLPPPPQPVMPAPAAVPQELTGAPVVTSTVQAVPHLSARKKLGITKPMAAVLVGLACAQGLLVAWFLGSLSKKSHAVEESKPVAAQTAPQASASQPAAAATASPAASAPAPEAAAPAAAAIPPEPPRKAPVGVDESGTVAPTCKSLLDPLNL